MEIEKLWAHIGRQQLQIDGLRDEITVLRVCLEDFGAVQREQYLAGLHRWRFAKVQQLHPSSCSRDGKPTDLGLRHALSIEELALVVARYTGPPALSRLSAASQAVGQAVGRLLPAMSTLFPQSVFVCGGNDGAQRLSSAERFNPVTQEWEVLPPMLERRSSVAAAVLTGRLYVCGGSNGMRILSSTECFDPSIGSWLPTVPMLERRERAVASVLARKLYVCGGFDGRQRLSSAERLNLEDQVWEPLPPTLESRSQAAAAVISGRLYICGGYDGSSILNSVECFDPAVGAWEPLPPILQRRSQAATAVLNGVLYLCGGYDGTERLSSVERFDPVISRWEVVMPIAERRSRAAAAVVSGRLYVFGGFNGEHRLSSAECYDLALNAWTPVTPMRCQREGAAAASLLWSPPCVPPSRGPQMQNMQPGQTKASLHRPDIWCRLSPLSPTVPRPCRWRRDDCGGNRRHATASTAEQGSSSGE